MNTQITQKSIKDLYDRDFNLWIEGTIEQLRDRQLDELVPLRGSQKSKVKSQNY